MRRRFSGSDHRPISCQRETDLALSGWTMQTPGDAPSATTRRRMLRARWLCCAAAAIACTSDPSRKPVVLDVAGASGAGPVSLFNGVDFAGWDRYLGKPSDAEPALGID